MADAAIAILSVGVRAMKFTGSAILCPRPDGDSQKYTAEYSKTGHEAILSIGFGVVVDPVTGQPALPMKIVGSLFNEFQLAG